MQPLSVILSREVARVALSLTFYWQSLTGNQKKALLVPRRPSHRNSACFARCSAVVVVVFVAVKILAPKRLQVGSGYNVDELLQLQNLLSPHWTEFVMVSPSVSFSASNCVVDLSESMLGGTGMCGCQHTLATGSQESVMMFQVLCWTHRKPVCASIHCANRSPDVVIDPSKSVLVEIKGAELTPTDQFSAGYALRFPRVLRLRLDKVHQSLVFLVPVFDDLEFRASMSACPCPS
jgi:hypothetical protein